MSPALTYPEVATRLIDNGYAPIPVHAGTKAAAITGFPEFARRVPSVRKAEGWGRKWPDASTGLVCGALVVLDLDIMDRGKLLDVVLCQEDAQASCCARDGGRPSGAALQEEASNCHELLWSKAAVVLCQEDAQASCCARDGGRPSGAALQEEASNCHELLRSKAAVVNVMVKRRGCDRVMYGSGRRAQANLR